MNAIFDIVVSNTVAAIGLALITLGLTRIYRSPQLRHLLWILVLLKLVMPPLLPLHIGSTWFRNESQPPIAAASSVSETASSVSATAVGNGNLPAHAIGLPDEHSGFRIPWTAVILVCWSITSLFYLALVSFRCLRFQALLRRTVEDEESFQRAAALAKRIGLARVPQVRLSNDRIPPLVWAAGLRPMVILPRHLIADLTPEQLDAVLAHELAHVRRRDHLVRWLEVVVFLFFWWNPVAWLARHRLRCAEEECCDAYVVWALPNHRRSYGQAMWKAIEFVTEGEQLPALAGSAFGNSFHQRRIKMVLKGKLNHRISRLEAFICLLIGLVVLPVAAQTSANAALPPTETPSSAAEASTAEARRNSTVSSVSQAAEERLLDKDEFRSVGERIARGELRQLEALNSMRNRLYADVDVFQDPERVVSNLQLMLTAFEPIAKAASANRRAMEALREAVMHRQLRSFAVVALGHVAAEGNSEALDMLLHYQRYNILKSSAVSALASAAKTGDDQVVGFLTRVAKSKQDRPLWYMAYHGLKSAAENGNKDAATVVENMHPLFNDRPQRKRK